MAVKTKPEPVKPGPKSKKTPEVQAKLIEALRDGCTNRAACAWAGISEAEFYEWQKESTEFKETCTRAGDLAEAGFTKVIQQAAEAGDWKAAESWLKRRRKGEWSERLEQTGADGGAIETRDVTDTERLERLIALSNAARIRRDGSPPDGTGGPE